MKTPDHSKNLLIRSCGLLLMASIALAGCAKSNETSSLPDAPDIQSSLVPKVSDSSDSSNASNNVQRDFQKEFETAVSIKADGVLRDSQLYSSRQAKTNFLLNEYCEAGAIFQREERLAYDRASNNYSIRTSAINEAYGKLTKLHDVVVIDDGLLKTAHDQCPDLVPFTHYVPSTG